jgi:hypothetical protein
MSLTREAGFGRLGTPNHPALSRADQPPSRSCRAEPGSGSTTPWNM